MSAATTPRPVLVGVDGSDASRAAVSAGTEEARLRGAPPRLLTITTWAVEDGDAVQSLSAAAAEAQLLVVGARGVVVRDRAAAALLATGLTAQLLVVGHRRRRVLDRLGSVTHAVVHRAGCPVAVVPLGGAR